MTFLESAKSVISFSFFFGPNASPCGTCCWHNDHLWCMILHLHSVLGAARRCKCSQPFRLRGRSKESVSVAVGVPSISIVRGRNLVLSTQNLFEEQLLAATQVDQACTPLLRRHFGAPASHSERTSQERPGCDCRKAAGSQCSPRKTSALCCSAMPSSTRTDPCKVCGKVCARCKTTSWQAGVKLCLK